MKRIGYSLLSLALGASLIPLVAAVSQADGLDGLVTAEAESYALRVQYDIPLPVGGGDIPHTVGEIRRTTAGENAKGLAAAPTHLGAVVAGQYINPNKEFDDPADYNRPPQAECFYPGDLVDVQFGFPTNIRTETENLPPISKSTAQCSAGPRSQLTGNAQYFEGFGVGARELESVSLMRADNGVDKAETSAHATNVKIAGGAIQIGRIGIAGESRVTGEKGGNATATRLTISDITIGPLKFSIADDRLIVGDQNVPLLGNVGQGIIDQANNLLVASQCRIDVITQPTKYPQGFLFSRPAPKVGLSEDGTFAASMRAGLMVLCDLPEGFPTQDLSPQRVQVVVGFAYTAASATADPGGFGLGNLGGSGDNGSGVPSLGNIGSIAAPLPDLAAAPTASAGNEADDDEGDVREVVDAFPKPIAVTPLNGSTRLTLILFCAVAWALLTHHGITRMRRTP